MKAAEINRTQIWIVVTDDFYVDSKISKKIKGNDRPVLYHVKKGEKLEIRYPYAWNFRLEDNVYVAAEPEEILKHCELYGIIHPDIKSANNATLGEILRIGLFDKCYEEPVSADGLPF